MSEGEWWLRVVCGGTTVCLRVLGIDGNGWVANFSGGFGVVSQRDSFRNGGWRRVTETDR